MFHVKQFEKLAEYCLKNGIRYGQKEEERFEAFYEFLIEKNKVMNLTAITEPEEVELRHYIDSVSSVPVLKELFGDRLSEEPVKGIDLGTGAGFPGIPLAIVLSEYRFTLADSLNKRVDFLKEAVKMMDLGNAEPLHGRAEEIGQSDLRESFDLCVSRAVADLSVLLEYCLPLVKIGGYAVLYKSGEFKDELHRAEYAMQLLGGTLQNVREFVLPGSDIRRSFIIIEKRNAAPIKYPRRSGKPSKSPLMTKQ